LVLQEHFPASQVAGARQGPHEPPQPSEPQSLPVHWGVQQVPATQVPPEQVVPSVFEDQPDWVLATAQTWQELPGFACPSLKQVVAIRHDPGLTEKTHAPAPSQASSVQFVLSSQEYRIPPQIPLRQRSCFVQALPSLQVVPSTARDHWLWLLAAMHTWQGFAGFDCPSVQHWPLIRQDPALGTFVHPPVPSQPSAVQDLPSSQE
jgi:hypothetical protein